MRVALGVEYDGSGFSGWQVQPGERSVQDCLQRAVSQVADEAIAVTGAGRTDAGVHALGQVAHFDTCATRPDHSWVLGVNVHLPADASVVWARPVAADFSARFSAVGRRYRYLVLNRRARSAVHRDRAWCVHAPLDEGRMQEAASRLLGEHDFSAFRSAHCQARTPRRTITDARVQRRGEVIVIEVAANAFLQNMVRIIAGVLVSVGSGKTAPEWVNELLEHGERTRSGMTAPAQGLYLAGVDYPPALELPGPAEGPWLP